MIPVLPGDGIGPIVTREAVRMLRAVGVTDLVEYPFGYACWKKTGRALPDATLDAIRAARVALVGAATTPDEGCDSPILELRRRLDLDLFVRPNPVATVVGLAWQGMYAHPETLDSDEAVLTRTLTAKSIDRLIAEAFQRATRSVTAVDKPSLFRGTATLIREAATRHARPGVSFELLNADAFVAALVTHPNRFEIVAAESFVADIVSDLAAALGRGVGAAPSASISSDIAVFEPVHGSAPRRMADHPPTVDPTGAVLAGAMLLDHMGQQAEASAIRAAVSAVVPTPGTPTVNVGDAFLRALP